LIFDKAELDSRISSFFSNYLINRKTQYVWNNLIFPFCKTDIGIDQSSASFPILFALYIASIFYIFEKRTQNILSPISIFMLSFIDNRLFISLDKNFEK